jgi:hypothetical protein
MIGTILYLPIGLIFMFFGLKQMEKKIFKARNDLHDMIVCNTGYSILRYSDEIRDGCFFETKLDRKCAINNEDYFESLKDIFSSLFSGLTSFNFVSVVNAIAIILFISYTCYYFIRPLFNKESRSELVTGFAVMSLFWGPVIVIGILGLILIIVLFVLWRIYAPKILPKEMQKSHYYNRDNNIVKGAVGKVGRGR